MFEIVNNFEKKIASFFNSKYCVATDSCTHAIELSLRLIKPSSVQITPYTYISIPFTLIKLNIPFTWKDEHWKNYYYIENTSIIDAAPFWRKNSYIQNTFMCLSFQNKKHLPLGRGGAILCDNYEAYSKLKKMSYDGRNLNLPWAEQDIDQIGYHYYMTPETALQGLILLEQVKEKPLKTWSSLDYPDLRKMSVFK